MNHYDETWEPTVIHRALEEYPAGSKEREELIGDCVEMLTRITGNETLAWNLWNSLASDKGAIRKALEWAWSEYRE